MNAYVNQLDLAEKPRTLTDVNHYLAKVSEIDHEIENISASAQEQITAVNNWMESRIVKLVAKKNHYLASIEGWLYANNTLSQELVHGRVVLRKQQPQILIVDEERVLSDGRFTRTVPSKHLVDRTALKKHLLSTGEEIPGTEVVQESRKLTYKLTKIGSEVKV